MARITVNKAALRRILAEDAAPHTRRIADRVAASVTAATGQVDGAAVDPQRFDEPGAPRARSAVLLHHPTKAGRDAANKAAPAAMQIAGE